MNELAGIGELTLDDLAELKDSPVAEELARIANQIDQEQGIVEGWGFNSYA